MYSNVVFHGLNIALQEHTLDDSILIISFFSHKEHVVSVDLDEEPIEPSTSTGGTTDFGLVEETTTVIIPADVVQSIANMANSSTVKHNGKGKSSVGRPPEKSAARQNAENVLDLDVIKAVMDKGKEDIYK